MNQIAVLCGPIWCEDNGCKSGPVKTKNHRKTPVCYTRGSLKFIYYDIHILDLIFFNYVFNNICISIILP